MIDFEEARDVFRQRIFDAGIFGTAIQWENRILQADEKGILWMTESYLPVTEAFNTASSDMIEGILQYNINITVGLPSGESTATDAAKALGNLFTTAEVITTENYKTSIGTPKRSFQGKLDDAWYTIVIDIDLKQYEV
jgi:hypothetical protein